VQGCPILDGSDHLSSSGGCCVNRNGHPFSGLARVDVPIRTRDACTPKSATKEFPQSTSHLSYYRTCGNGHQRQHTPRPRRLRRLCTFFCAGSNLDCSKRAIICHCPPSRPKQQRDTGLFFQLVNTVVDHSPAVTTVVKTTHENAWSHTCPGSTPAWAPVTVSGMYCSKRVRQPHPHNPPRNA
jgi:hypothetical protein